MSRFADDPILTLMESMAAMGGIGTVDGPSGTPGRIGDIQKALDTEGSASLWDMEDLNNGRAISLEKLDKTLINVMDLEEFFQLAKSIPVSRMKERYERFTRQTSYGENSGLRQVGMTHSEIGLPTVKDVSMKADVGIAKFMRDARARTHVIDVSATSVDPKVLNDRSAALKMLHTMEQQFLYGDEDLVETDINGLLKEIKTANDSIGTGSNKLNINKPIINDLRGEALELDHLQDGAVAMNHNRVVASHIFGSLDLMAYLDKEVLRNSVRFDVNTPVGKDLYVGHPVAGYKCSDARGGLLKFKRDRYILSGNDDTGKPTGAIGTSPDTSGCTASATAAAGDSDSQWTADDEGQYFYQVQAISGDGNAAALTTAAVTVESGEKVTIAVDAPGSTPLPTAWRIYRSAKNAPDATDCRYIGSEAAEADGSLDGYVDNNETIPDCGIALMMDLGRGKGDPHRPFEFRELLPFFRIPAPFMWGDIFGYTDTYGRYGYLRINKAGFYMIKNIAIPGLRFPDYD